MKALGVILPVEGPLRSRVAIKGKQQWCYLCDAAHDYHPYEEAY